MVNLFGNQEIKRHKNMLRFRYFCYLLEAITDRLKQQYPEHSDTIDRLDKLDTTSTKKYIRPLLRMHINGVLDHSDSQIKDTINDFELHGNKIEEKGKRDFGSYDSLEDVNKELKPHVENYQYKIRTSQKAKEGNKIIYDNGKGLKVRRIDNPEAACKYGSGSKWCVSSTYASVKDPGDPYGDSKTGKITKETDNHIYLKFDDVPHPLPFRKIHVLKHNAFHSYSHGGKNKMYIIHDENNGRKFAYHEGEDGDITRDEKDENIGTSNLVNMYPELSKIDELKKTVGGHHFIGSQEDFDDKFNEHFNKNNIKLQNLLKSNYLTDKHIDRLLSDENKFQPPVDIEKHPNIKDRHIDRLIDLGQSQNLLYNIPEKIKPEHIDKMFEENLHMGQNLAGLILQHPSVQYRHLKSMILNDNKDTRLFEVAFKPWINMDSDKINQALSDKELPKEYKNLLMINKKLTPDHITKALQDPEPETRAAFLSSKKSTDDHIRQGLSDEHPAVKETARRIATERGIK